MTNKMHELYELTKRFNTISGAINETSSRAFVEQYSYIREEFNELATTLGEGGNYPLSLESYMLEPALDDCLDIVITVFGFLQKLEQLGIDVNGAAIATANNNLDKYPVRPAVAYETVERKLREGVVCTANFHAEYGVYVIRNTENGKVVKPYNFVPNNLNSFIPLGTEIK